MLGVRRRSICLLAPDHRLVERSVARLRRGSSQEKDQHNGDGERVEHDREGGQPVGILDVQVREGGQVVDACNDQRVERPDDRERRGSDEQIPGLETGKKVRILRSSRQESLGLKGRGELTRRVPATVGVIHVKRRTPKAKRNSRSRATKAMMKVAR